MYKKVVILIFALLAVLSAYVACAGPVPYEGNNYEVTQSTAVNPQTKQNSFGVADLQINPAEADPGQEINITALVRNTNAVEITYIAELKINGLVEEVTDVLIPSGETKTLNFSLYRYVPGLYDVTLGESTGQFLVVSSNEGAQRTDSTNAAAGLPLAPDFSGVDILVNERISLEQFKGSTVLLNFVNYGCSQNLNKIVSAQLMVIRDLRQQRTDFVPISVFCGCCSPEVLRDFATKNNLNWTWILDTENSIIPQYGDYIIENGFPTLVLIDGNSNIKDVTGYCDYFTLNNKLDEI